MGVWGVGGMENEAAAPPKFDCAHPQRIFGSFLGEQKGTRRLGQAP